MNELISVIVPVYKTERYLNACVDSVLAQTYQNIEVILVDDGSPDHCPRLCDEYARRDSRVRVIHQQNQGLSAARNSGIEAASGTLLSFLDSDDLYAPNFLARLYGALTSCDGELAVCRSQRFSRESELRPDAGSEPRALSRDEAFQCLFDARNQDMVVANNKLYRRELFGTVRYPVGRIHEDESVIHELIGQTSRVVWLEDVLYHYRYTENSITTSKFSLKNLDEMKAKEDRIRYFEKQGLSELADRTRVAYLSNLMRLYRLAQAEMEQGADRARALTKINTRFREIYGKKLLERCSAKMRLRCRAFRLCPGFFARIEYTRLEKKHNA